MIMVTHFTQKLWKANKLRLQSSKWQSFLQLLVRVSAIQKQAQTWLTTLSILKVNFKVMQLFTAFGRRLSYIYKKKKSCITLKLNSFLLIVSFFVLWKTWNSLPLLCLFKVNFKVMQLFTAFGRRLSYIYKKKKKKEKLHHIEVEFLFINCFLFRFMKNLEFPAPLVVTLWW